MALSQKIRIYGVGTVLLERSRRARRIVITVRPGQGVRVAVPRNVTFNSAVAFVRSKQAWLKKHLQKADEYEKQKQYFENFFLTIDQAEAERKIIARLRQLARRHGFIYNKVSIRNQRTRWGSCSPKGNISLNIKLVALPQELFDYVLLHELVHTRIHNHSNKFWQELDKYVGDGRAIAHRMIEYGVRLL
jgi:predicted metal-dependent hydrolase